MEMVRALHDLPDPLMDEIMSWVAGETLVECKRVNKSWHCHISDLLNHKKFVEKHSYNCRDNTSIQLVIRQTESRVGCEKAKRFLLLTLTRDDGVRECLHCVAQELNLPPLAKEIGFPFKNSSWEVVSHYDGILCLVKNPRDMDVMLCNPLLQEFKLLPQSKNAKTNGHYSTIGFGYDSKAEDYKFLRVINFIDALAEIYTLGTNSWRDISMPKDILSTTLSEAVYLKGVCYWEMASKEYKDMVLSFDMCDEVFHKILLPDQSTFPTEWRSLTVWNGSVALLNCTTLLDQGSVSFEVCVMAAYRDILKGGAPWIKSLVVRPQLGYWTPSTFWNNEEVLMKAKGGRLCSYNVRTEKVRQIGVRGFVNTPPCFYEMSLVPLRRL